MAGPTCPVTLRWKAKKADLPERDLAASFTFSKDIVVGTGAKAFAIADSVHDAAAFARYHRGSPLNEVLVDARRALHGVCDCDRPDTQFSTARVVADLLLAWNTFLTTVCDFPFHASPGTGCQISTASTDVKTSVHVKFDFIVPSMTAHLVLAKQLKAFVLASRAEYASLVFDKPSGEVDCVIDVAIYTEFRSWRALFMVKIGKANPLIPFPGCSRDPLDHFVGVYDGVRYDHLPVVTVPDPPAALGIARPVAKKPARLAAGGSTSSAGTSGTDKSNEEWTNTLNVWPDTLKVLGAPVQIVAVGKGFMPGVVSLRCARSTVCPYAGRAHASNNLYLRVNVQQHFAVVVCHDDDCKDKCHESAIGIACGTLPGHDLNTHDAVYRETLHTQEKNVQWDDVYDEPEMRPYPLAEFVTVRAGMGTGKTKELVNLLRKVCNRSSKILVISYSRALCIKSKATFDAELPQLEFTNYLAVSGPIRERCIVVCLDSLERIDTRNFDFLILDEVASILSHFNSPLMKQTGSITTLFELLILQAKHVYAMDALVDSTPVRTVVDYIARHKGVEPYDIWNRYVRPSNRKVKLVVCEPSASPMIAEQTLMHAALSEVGARLDAGENVVVPTSTKSFAKVIDLYLADRYPDLPRKVYHGGNASVRLATIDVDWPKLRVLVYSPSISAGVSFEVPHFDSCVAYFVSSRHTPGVDTSLQQLFRVRGLTIGDMSLFVHVVPPSTQLPVTAFDISDMLTTDLTLLKRFGTNVPLAYEALTTISADRVCYDPERLSYQIILGIIIGQNRSASSYTELLRETLTVDYRIPVDTVVQKALSKDRYDIDLALLRTAAKAAGVPYADIHVMNDEEYENLKDRLVDATDAERASARLHIVRSLWGIKPELVDESFYEEYVLGSGSDLYPKVKRRRSIQRYTYSENKGRFAQKLGDMLFGVEPNMAIFKSKVKEHHSKLIVTQEVLTNLLSYEQMAALHAFEPVHFSAEAMESAAKAVLEAGTEEERKQLRVLFGITGSSPYKAFRHIVRKGAGLSLVRASASSERAGFGKLTLVAGEERDIVAKYGPSFPWI
jgi:hypothetical protein